MQESFKKMTRFEPGSNIPWLKMIIWVTGSQAVEKSVAKNTPVTQMIIFIQESLN